MRVREENERSARATPAFDCGSLKIYAVLKQRATRCGATLHRGKGVRRGVGRRERWNEIATDSEPGTETEAEAEAEAETETNRDKVTGREKERGLERTCRSGIRSTAPCLQGVVYRTLSGRN